jgi:hypothetical protein
MYPSELDIRAEEARRRELERNADAYRLARNNQAQTPQEKPSQARHPLLQVLTSIISILR